MNTTRTDSRKRERDRRRKRCRKLVLGVVAAAAVCAAGALMWKQNASVPSPLSAPTASTDAAAGAAFKPQQTAGSGEAQPSKAQATGSGKPAAGVTETGGTSPVAGISASGSMQEGDDAVKLAFVGDVLFAGTVEAQLKQNGYDYPYREVKNCLEEPDVTAANLETPVSERGAAALQKEYTYRSSPQALPAFVQAGFDLVNLANNHVLDYGRDALLDTLSHLDKEGIRRVGAGRDEEEAFSPVIVERKGIKLAFLGFSRVVPDVSWYAGKGKPGVAGTYDHLLPQVKKAIDDARAEADLVIVMVHWGLERKEKPEQYQRNLAHMYIDAGADLVVGSHPHVLQGFEMYKGKWIAYSLGNFLFTTNEVSATWETVILEAACGRDRRCELNAVPILNKWAKPEVMSEENGRKLFERLTRISFGARVDSTGRIGAESSIR